MSIVTWMGIGTAAGAALGYLREPSLGSAALHGLAGGAGGALGHAALGNGGREAEKAEPDPGKVPPPPQGRPTPKQGLVATSPSQMRWVRVYQLPLRGVGARTFMDWMYVSPEIISLIRKQNDPARAAKDVYAVDEQRPGQGRRRTWHPVKKNGQILDYVFTGYSTAFTLDVNMTGWHPNSIELVEV